MMHALLNDQPLKVYAVRWRVSSTVEVIQYGGGYSVRRKIPSVRWRVDSKDLSHHHYECVASSVRWRMCSKDLSHQYGAGCEVQIKHIMSTDEGVQNRTTKIAQGVVGDCIYLGKIFYRQYYYNLDLILPWLYLDVAEIPLGC